MLKLLILFPLLLIGGMFALGAVLPLLALLPLALAVGAGVLAFAVVFSILGVLLRLIAGLLIGAGVLFTGALGFGLLFAGGAVFLAVGAVAAHLLVPVLLIVGLIWLVRRASRPPALPAPSPHS